MLFLFVSLTLSKNAPSYTTITASKFMQMQFEINSGKNDTYSVKADSYNVNNDHHYVLRDKGDNETGIDYTFYRILGTAEEIAILKSNFQMINDSETNISDLTGNISFIVLEKSASYYQMSTFWVNIVVWIIFIAFALGGYLIWHCDDYSKDPNNSLLFVTEGNRIVSGE